MKGEGGTESGNNGLEDGVEKVLMVDIGRSQGNEKGTYGRSWKSCGSILYFVSFVHLENVLVSFSSVFTTQDISSLPAPFTKFKGSKSEHLLY